MSEPIIEVKNVTVKYVTGDLRNIGLKEYFMKRLKRDYRVDAFEAVSGVSFTLEHGDMLGIIGSNGAGKSTLLKVVTQIMEPSSGSVKVNGKIAALLELASGFDGDLDLKENAYLRGAMLGYTREFMDRKFPEILRFSELEAFEKRPLKQLSSGMRARIAFSIAAMLDPEILILDEVLAVGDGAFREKSEAKMHDIIANGKATILVSHSIPQIRRMCNKILWLNAGKQVEYGTDVNAICDRYEQHLRNTASAQTTMTYIGTAAANNTLDLLASRELCDVFGFSGVSPLFRVMNIAHFSPITAVSMPVYKLGIKKPTVAECSAVNIFDADDFLTDANKTLFMKLEKRHGEMVMLDISTILKDVNKASVPDGNSAYFEDVPAFSAYIHDCNVKVSSVSVSDMNEREIFDALKEYCKRLTSVYSQEHIILVEAYPPSSYMTEDGLHDYDKDFSKAERKLLKKCFDYAVKQIPKALIIRQPDSIIGEAPCSGRRYAFDDCYHEYLVRSLSAVADRDEKHKQKQLDELCATYSAIYKEKQQ